MKESSELSKVSLYLRAPYSASHGDRRKGGGGNLRREDRRISERRKGGLDLIGPNRRSLERLRAA